MPRGVKFHSDYFIIDPSSKILIDKSSSVVFEGPVTILKFAILLAYEKSTLTLGDRVYIGDYSTVRATRTQITIGADTIVGSHVKLIATNHAYLRKDMIIRDQDIDTVKIGLHIGKDCWLGAGCCILPGVTLGDGVVVGANSVVTKNVPNYAVVVGNPAKIIKYRR